MKNPFEIATILEAKSYIDSFKNGVDRSGQPTTQVLADRLFSLADLYRSEMTLENYDSYKISLVRSIDSIVTKMPAEQRLNFQPVLFFLLKFDFAIADDSDANGIVRYCLLNALSRAFDLPDDSLTINIVSKCENYLMFVLQVDSIRNLLSSETLEPEHNQSQDSNHAERPSYLANILAANAKEATYREQVTQIEEVKQQFDQAVASQFAEALKAEIVRQAKTYDTIEEKRELVEWLNSEVKRMGLTYKNPKVDAPATLFVDKGRRQEVGRFQFRTSVEDTGTGKTESLSTDSIHKLIENIKLMVQPARKEGWVEFYKNRSANLSDGAPHI